MNLLLAKHMARYLTAGSSIATNKMKKEVGQGSLEYIAILIGLIVIVAILFYFFGHEISRVGCEAIHNITGDSSGCTTQPATNPGGGVGNYSN